VLDIRLESVGDPVSLDRKQLTPTAGMTTGPVLHDAVHLFAGIPDGARQRPTIIRPVIVHAVFGPGGSAIETEIAGRRSILRKASDIRSLRRRERSPNKVRFF